MSPRDRILERRAAFVAASLSIAGCGTTQSPPAAPAPPAPASGSAATASSESAPPDEPPKDVSPELQGKYRGLATRLRQVRVTLDRIDHALEKCASGAASAACVAARDEAAVDAHLVDHELGRIRYVCKPKDPGERGFAVHANAEVKLLRQRLDALESKWKNAAGSAEWDEARQRAAMAKPVPCLSFVCDEWM